MTCEDFQKNLNLLLDKNTDQSLSEENDKHSISCKSCNDYKTFMLSLHERLKQIPREKPSASFIAQIKSYQNKLDKLPALPSWQYDARRVLVLLSPLVLLFLSNFFPSYVGALINFGILTAGLAFLLTKVLKPIFFTRS